MLDSKRHRFIVVILLATVLQIGCGIQADPEADAAAKAAAQEEETKETAKQVLGEWVMDLKATVKASKAALKSIVDVDEYEKELNKATLEFQLYEDGTFSCHQIMGQDDAEYSGVYGIKENKVILNQTHRGEEPESDQLSGELKNAKLHLVHKQQGIEIPYILRRPK